MADTTNMLRKSRKMGVDAVVFTSHCYPVSAADVRKFIEKRTYQKGYFRYQPEWGDPPFLEMPKFFFNGCEVHLTGDISQISNIKELCIENTDYMLLEMPMKKWTNETIENVYKLTLLGIKPIIAHDERNMHQSMELRNALYDLDVLVQINAPILMMREYKKDIDHLFAIGMVHVIGTDMHNLTTRPPCMDKARKIIKKRYGRECWQYLHNNATRILEGETISYRDFKSFKKLSPLSKEALNWRKPLK
jgi:protein-tyrosine phosphatase